MEYREHLSLEMEKLADTLARKMESLHRLSKDCSIYRIPEPRRCLNPSQYTPQMVSIGPLHHGKEKLKDMEEHKLRYLNYFLQRTQVSMVDFLAFTKGKEKELRNCYSETIHLNSDELVTIVFVDVVFIIELFLRRFLPQLRTDDDRIFGNLALFHEMVFDFWLLENQIPMFILIDVFNLAKTATNCDLYTEISFAEIACNWFAIGALGYLSIDKNLLEINFSRAKHFLDLFILSLHSSSNPQSVPVAIKLQDQSIPSAKELHQAGVKFKSGSSKNLMDIRFNEGALEIPFLTVYSSIELILRNLLAYEHIHGYPRRLNDYVVMMRYFITGPKDTEILSENGIVGLAGSGILPIVFENLEKDCLLANPGFRYSSIVANLQEYCKKPRNKWKATLKQNYFNTPWASISVIAASILLLLTIIQTVCSIIAL